MRLHLLALAVVQLIHFSVQAAPLCRNILLESNQPSYSQALKLGEWQGQAQVHKDMESLTSADPLFYSYSTKNDRNLYNTLKDAVYRNLSDAQVESLRTYSTLTGHYHEQLSKAIEGLQISQPLHEVPWADAIKSLKGSAAVKADVKNILSAFSQGVLLPQNTILFRGIPSYADMSLPRAGRTLMWSRLTSTSMDPESAFYFAKGERPIMFVIDVKHPVVALVAATNKEMEFILPPGTKFLVKKNILDRANDVRIVHLETVGN